MFKIRQTLKACYFMFDGNIIKPNPTNVSMKAARCQCNIKKSCRRYRHYWMQQQRSWRAWVRVGVIKGMWISLLHCSRCLAQHSVTPPAIRPVGKEAITESSLAPSRSLCSSWPTTGAIAINRHILQQICVIANLHSTFIPSHIFWQRLFS